MATTIMRIVRSTLLQHFLFWIICFYILLQLFASSSRLLPIDYIYTIIFMITLMLPVYINLLLWMPRYLQQGKYIGYGALVLATLGMGTYFNLILFDKLIDYVLPGYYFISYYEFTDLLKFFVTLITATSLLKLSKEWIQLNETKERMQQLEKEKLTAELRALMNQVNPHFLFNSLTVLYSLALRKATETPEAIIKLSDILRYVIYESNALYVPVRSEVKVLHDYIHLQRYRIGSEAAITFDVALEEDVSIAPMILLQLVENSFKHGIKGDTGNTFINMHLKADRHQVDFKIENNKGQGEEFDKNQVKGIGLHNIRERVRLLYGDRGIFDVTETGNIFRVHLRIRPEEITKPFADRR
jgi:sensor histidine kinase YesM